MTILYTFGTKYFFPVIPPLAIIYDIVYDIENPFGTNIKKNITLSTT